MIELIRSGRTFYGVRLTFVDWHFQSRMDQPTIVHIALNFFSPFWGTSALDGGDTWRGSAHFPLGGGDGMVSERSTREEYDLHADDLVAETSSTSQCTQLRRC